jgi:hypothetical protein
MHRSGAEQDETIRSQFDRSLMIDSWRHKITWDMGFLLLRERDERFCILAPMGSEPEHTSCCVHRKGSLLQMTCQRIFQMAVGSKDFNDADFLQSDPAICLAVGKGDEASAGQSRLSRIRS